MKFKDLILMAIKNLNSRRLRTFLTVLGVVIGATSIIIMLSIGFGFKKLNNDMWASMGDLSVLDLRQEVWFGNKEDDSKPKKEKKLNDQAVNEIKKLKHVKAVLPIYKGHMALKSGRYTNGYVNIIALPPELMEEFGYKLGEGRLLNKSDSSSGVVLSSNVTDSFRDEKRSTDAKDKIDLMKSRMELSDFSVDNPSSNPNDYQMPTDDSNSEDKKVYTEKLRVVGVLQKDENGWDNYNTAIMSMDYFKKLAKNSEALTNGKKSDFKVYNNIKVKVDGNNNVDAVKAELKDLGYNASNVYADILKQQNQMMFVIQAVFGAIGAVAFLVAAIGITNTMIMSIYERTREIGVMKVIGASIKDIQKLFLVEAGFIGFFGGVCGVIFSKLLSTLFNMLTRGWLLSQMGPDSPIKNPKISYIPIWLILMALGFSTLVGVIAGYLPARRAMKLSALDAIRSE